MSNKKFILGTVVVVITMLMPSSVFALSSDLHYQFSTENQEEFVQKGETNVHFNGVVPDYLLDIYDLTPQQTHNSEFGATIIVPEKAGPNATTYAPSSAPSGGYTQSPKGLYNQGRKCDRENNLSFSKKDFRKPMLKFPYMRGDNVS